MANVLRSTPLYCVGLHPLSLFKDSSSKRSQIKTMKSSLYSRYYVEVCNEWRGPSPRLKAWTTQHQRNQAVGGAVFDLTSPGIELRLPALMTVSWTTSLCSINKYGSIEILEPILILLLLQVVASFQEQESNSLVHCTQGAGRVAQL